MYINGITIIEARGKEVFIPFNSINRIIIEEEKDFNYTKKNIFESIHGEHYHYKENGKWELIIETIGKTTNVLTVETKEQAETLREGIREGYIKSFKKE